LLLLAYPSIVMTLFPFSIKLFLFSLSYVSCSSDRPVPQLAGLFFSISTFSLSWFLLVFASRPLLESLFRNPSPSRFFISGFPNDAAGAHCGYDAETGVPASSPPRCCCCFFTSVMGFNARPSFFNAARPFLPPSLSAHVLMIPSFDLSRKVSRIVP